MKRVNLVFSLFQKYLAKKYPFIFTIVFVVISLQYPLRSLEYSIYDFFVQSDFFAEDVSDTVIVYMDEKSNSYLGETYPYSYASQSRAFKKLIKDGPKEVVYLFALPEPKNEIDLRYAEEFSEDIRRFQETKVIRQAVEFGTSGEKRDVKLFRSVPRDIAVVTSDSSIFAKDDVARRIILNVSGDDSLYLKVANDIRKQKSLPPLGGKTISGSYYQNSADAMFAMIKQPVNPTKSNEIKTISFYQLVTGNFPEGYFRNKNIFIGSKNEVNAADYILTPYNKHEYTAPKILFQVQAMLSLASKKTVSSVNFMFSKFFVFLMVIFLSIIVSKTRPGKGLMITIASAVGVLMLSWFLFSFFGLWIKIAHILFSILVVYYIWIPFRAIDEYQQRFAIEEEAKLLKKVEGLKKNFISLMSHDLKTPVAKIAGIVDMVARQVKEEAAHKGLGQIKDATKELNGFITSILDLSKVESSNLELNKVSKDINVILEEIIASLKFEAREAEVGIETELAPLYPIQVDVKLMTRVFSNLIENAIKYSGKKSKIEIKTWDDETWVYIKIKDNGVGIAEVDLEHIFDKFYRVKNDANHQIKGSGLGLYLVKYFVELHGGQISAQSTIGEGTEFTVKMVNQ